MKISETLLRAARIAEKRKHRSCFLLSDSITCAAKTKQQDNAALSYFLDVFEWWLNDRNFKILALYFAATIAESEGL